MNTHKSADSSNITLDITPADRRQRDRSAMKCIKSVNRSHQIGHISKIGSRMLTVRSVDVSCPEEYARVKGLRCQSEFVEDIGSILAWVKGNEFTHSYVMSLDDDLVGYFCVHMNYGKSVEYVPSDAVGLIDYFVDSRYQGLGIGKRVVAELPALLKQDFPKLSHIYLAVNHRNPGAKHCYLKAGFEVFGDGYVGTAGPGDVMRLALD